MVLESTISIFNQSRKNSSHAPMACNVGIVSFTISFKVLYSTPKISFVREFSYSKYPTSFISTGIVFVNPPTQGRIWRRRGGIWQHTSLGEFSAFLCDLPLQSWHQLSEMISQLAVTVVSSRDKESLALCLVPLRSPNMRQSEISHIHPNVNTARWNLILHLAQHHIANALIGGIECVKGLQFGVDGTEY